MKKSTFLKFFQLKSKTFLIKTYILEYSFDLVKPNWLWPAKSMHGQDCHDRSMIQKKIGSGRVKIRWGSNFYLDLKKIQIEDTIPTFEAKNLGKLRLFSILLDLTWKNFQLKIENDP